MRLLVQQLPDKLSAHLLSLLLPISTTSYPQLKLRVDT